MYQEDYFEDENIIIPHNGRKASKQTLDTISTLISKCIENEFTNLELVLKSIIIAANHAEIAELKKYCEYYLRDLDKRKRYEQNVKTLAAAIGKAINKKSEK